MRTTKSSKYEKTLLNKHSLAT